MDILTALKVSLFGFAVVFAALILISLSIKIISIIIASFEKTQKSKSTVSAANTPAQKADTEVKEDTTVGAGELKLFNVDEKTAAMIMAIVSDETRIPLEELQFKSIKLLEN